MKFRDLELIEPILRALSDKKYKEATPIQEKAIPVVLKGSDILASAQTGTGKTAAFAIPIIQRIQEMDGQSNKTKLRALIMTPTRELAIQIDENIRDYSKYTDLRHLVVFGGVKQGKQVKKLQSGIDILVATPGRLLDLHNQGFINFNDLKLFVLDEADRMLDMGFINDIRRLIKLIPKNRQSLFFSATLPNNIIKLSQDILKNPVKIEVARTSTTAETVKQEVYYTNGSTKRDMLLYIIENIIDDQVLIFSRTKHGADKIVRYLKSENYNAAAIHGNKSQNQRQAALKDFKNGKVQIMVATDIASRGIDIDKLKYVINYNIPNVAEDYVHRIGRTGRAGESGLAISICESEENAFLRSVEKLIARKIPAIDGHPYPQTQKPMTEREKKEFNKEKERKKRERIAQHRARKEEKRRSGSGSKSKSKSKSAAKSGSSSRRKDRDGSGSEGKKPWNFKKSRRRKSK